MGLFISEFTTWFRSTCDPSKYGWQWGSLHTVTDYPFQCKDQTQLVQRETNPIMLYKLIKNDMLYYFVWSRQ